MKIKEWFSYDKIIKYLLIGVIWFAFIFTSITPCNYMEVDSYVLPIISIEYRGSLIITQKDIEQAKIDLPSLYNGVNSYEDLRSSKLVKLDDDNWLPCYFPVYAIVCLPMKLLLQVANLDQVKCFPLTNVLLFALSLIMLYRYLKKEGKQKSTLLALLIISPIWAYFQYIGGEPVMFSAIIIALVCWRQNRYKTAALIISITCMMNPTIMGIGIWLFLDYFFKEFLNNKKFLFNKKGLTKTLLLCCCYIPSLIPFIANLILLGVLNPIVGSGGPVSLGDSLTERFLQYFLDLNFGVASISVVVVVLFVLALLYSVIKRNQQIFMECMAAAFTVALFSLMPHINCGMINCSRYILWVYPVIVFAVCGFLEKLFHNKFRMHLGVIFVSVVYTIAVWSYNGFIYSYLYPNKVTENILDRWPQFYVTFCDSTFNSRVMHIDGGYNIQGYAIYFDSDNGEIRKILYHNKKKNKDELLKILESEQDENLVKFREFLQIKNNDNNYYISIPRDKNVQYQVSEYYSSGIYGWMQRFLYYSGKELSVDDTWELAKEVYDNENGISEKLYEYFKDDSLSTQEYVHKLYISILGREESKKDNYMWSTEIEGGTSRYEVFRIFVNSEEFKGQY